MKRIRILVVDDHALIRHGLSALLRSQADFTIAGEAADGEEAVAAAHRLRPDLVIMDLSMPVLDGVEATRRIRETLPTARILLLTTFGTSADVTRALRYGASGALVKDTDDDELLAAVRTVAGGGTVFSPEIQAMLREPQPPELTGRQREILEAIVRGLATDGIAAKLGISSDTVNQHINAIREKLGAANRAEAVAIALRRHLLKI